VSGASEAESESTWAKLRRRKVVQWGIAYAAAAWGFLQGLQYVSDAFGWPPQLRQLAIVALLIGLPIVLVIAWYHGDRGEQRITRIELAIVTLLFLVGGGIFWRFERATEAPPARAVAPAEKAGDGRPSIAVLPFENRSDQSKDAYFVDGIHDDILTQLAKMSAMKVISRTSVERFRDTKLPLTQVAQQLGVTKILEGGVQRAGDRVRITVQLIDAATDGHVWAESYDRELTAANIFAIQSEVATAIAAALNAALSPAEKSRVNAVPTRNLAAWEAYQLGRQRMANRTGVGLSEAEKFFERAITLDPNFALAYTGLADTLALQAGRGFAPLTASLDRAERAGGIASKLDPQLAEAWASAGLVAQIRAQSSRAESMYRRAIALNPNNATAYQWLGGLLGDQGRFDESRSALQRALQIDPLSAIIHENLAEIFDATGQFDAAEAHYRRVIEIDPSIAYPYLEMGTLEAYGRNRFAEAVELVEKSIERDPENSLLRLSLVQLYLDLGDDEQAQRIGEEIRSRWPSKDLVLTFTGMMAMFRGDTGLARRLAAGAIALAARNSQALAVLNVVESPQGNHAEARARYAAGFPELLIPDNAKVDATNWAAAVDLVQILRKTGEGDAADALLNSVESYIRTIARLGGYGFGIADVQILALRGRKQQALTALRTAEREGWRGGTWPIRYYRDFDPALASIRGESDFKAVFADIDRDMARQRAELAARPKDAPLDFARVP
jgi:TolB-like protein/Flp pilus assembly protein TadD